MSPRTRVAVSVAAVFCALIAVVIAVRADANPTVRLSIAVNDAAEYDSPILPASAGWPYSERIVHDWGFAEEFDFDMELVPRVTGKGTIETLLDDNADLAVVAATPVIAALSKGEEVLVLAQTERSFNQIRLVVRSDHVDDWFEQPIGCLPGTVFYSALAAELDHLGQLDALRDGTIDLVGAKDPSALVNALIEDTISSTIMLQPQAALLTRSEGSNAGVSYIDITTPGLYEFDTFLVTTRNRWEANRDGIQRALRATKASRQLIRDDPESRLREIHNYEAGETALRDSPPWFWSADELVFITDRDEMTEALRREAELQVASGVIDVVPDLAGAFAVRDEIAQLQ